MLPVYAYFNDSTKNNSKTTFVGNHGEVSGGAINIAHYNSPASLNIFELTECKFTNNSALVGAGLTFYSSYANQSFLGASKSFIITNSAFISNSGVLSSAIDIAPLDQ